ncbi:hypothetical protein ATANTOWER_010722 [Ataeniobius toweri]|uniref:Uncharacterized protein n=1 Tax=Ataeniobius toweri TaxID=208326 RepID=A0ABU7BYE8_9TELE|nr:hypothetical protein [Ataeniobius toweri]
MLHSSAEHVQLGLFRVEKLRVAPMLVSMATPHEPNSPICHGCQPANGAVCVSALRSVCSSVHLSSRSVSVSLCCWNARGNAGLSFASMAKHTEMLPSKPFQSQMVDTSLIQNEQRPVLKKWC